MTDDRTPLTLAQPDHLLDTVAGIARRRGRQRNLSRDEIDDVTQTVLTRYAAYRADGRRPDNVGGFLERSVSNAITDVLRGAERRRAVAVDPQAGGGEDEDPLADVLQALRSPQPASVVPVHQDLEQRVWRLVSSADADLLRRRFVEERSADDVADVLGISRAAVDQRVRRARLRLRAALTSDPELLEELRAGHPQIY